MKRMKQMLTSLFFLFAMIGVANAQHMGYGRQWNVLHSQPDQTVVYRYTVIYHSSEGDTVSYDNHIYSYVYYECGCISETPVGMYREEEGKTYFRGRPDHPTNNGEEYLIYDWNLSIGDTVFVQSGEADNGLVLKSIGDAILNGETRRQFNFTYLSKPDSTELWIEGMGSELGFPFSGTKLKPASPFGFQEHTEMLCFHEADDLLWQNPRYDTCLINFGSLVPESMGENKVTVFPNPTKKDLSLRFVDAMERSIDIYDSMGRKVLSLETAEQQVQVGFENQPSGVYFIKVKSGEGTAMLKCIKR